LQQLCQSWSKNIIKLFHFWFHALHRCNSFAKVGQKILLNFFIFGFMSCIVATALPKLVKNIIKLFHFCVSCLASLQQLCQSWSKNIIKLFHFWFHNLHRCNSFAKVGQKILLNFFTFGFITCIVATALSKLVKKYY